MVFFCQFLEYVYLIQMKHFKSKVIYQAAIIYFLLCLIITFHCDAASIPCSCHSRLLIFPCLFKQYFKAILCLLRIDFFCFVKKVILSPISSVSVILQFIWIFIIEPLSKIFWPITWILTKLFNIIMYMYYCCFPFFEIFFSVLKVTLTPLKFVLFVLSPASYPECNHNGTNYWNDTFKCITIKTKKQFMIPLKCINFVIHIVDEAVVYFSHTPYNVKINNDEVF